MVDKKDSEMVSGINSKQGDQLPLNGKLERQALVMLSPTGTQPHNSSQKNSYTLDTK